MLKLRLIVVYLSEPYKSILSLAHFQYETNKDVIISPNYEHGVLVKTQYNSDHVVTCLLTPRIVISYTSSSLYLNTRSALIPIIITRPDEIVDMLTSLNPNH